MENGPQSSQKQIKLYPRILRYLWANPHVGIQKIRENSCNPWQTKKRL